jgi:hypothetical protein
MSSGPIDPRIISLGARSVAVRWSSRAAYRIDTLRPRPTLQQARDGGSDGFAFLVAHLWAMLHDERDRRRFATPEDLAAEIDPDRSDMPAVWRFVFLDAFGVDIDAPDPIPTDKQKSGSQGSEPPHPSIGLAP